MKKLTDEQLEVLVKKRNEAGLKHTVEVMTNEELKAYRINCVDAINHRKASMNKGNAGVKGGIVQRIKAETIEQLENYIAYIDAKLSEDTEPKKESAEGLTEKETNVLKSMFNNTDEFGLPVETGDIKGETGYSKRSITGILSSLYKKGLVEKYDYELENEFMLSEEGYDLVLGW